KSVSIKLNSHSEIFLDDSSQLKFEDILNPEIQSRFRKNTEGRQDGDIRILLSGSAFSWK
ncbi:MAG: hypothetical protein OEZ34_06580, partial [Spirochaetia bacterium]|nr:hypothetical protein [Spirochaetia bacterium]